MLLDAFITGALAAGIFTGVPALYKLGKQKKAEAIQNRKVYYGLLGCRIIGLFVLGIISADLLLMFLLGDSVEGTMALLLMFLVSLPFTVLYLFIYKKSFEKKLKRITNIGLQPQTNPVANRKNSFCRICGSKLAEGSQFCHKCGTKVISE